MKMPKNNFALLVRISLIWSCAALLSCQASSPYPDLIPIGKIQGEVTTEADPTRFRSAFLRETVKVRGVVHQVLRWTTGEGESVYALLMQNTKKDADKNPDTSDGIFVYTGRYPTLPMTSSGEYEIRTGDLITVEGEVNERYGQTELADARVLEVESGEFMGKLEVREVTSLPDSIQERDRLLENLEGMRIRFPAGAVAVSGTHPNNRTGDMNLWVVPPSHPVAGREDTAARRLYRPTHPKSNLQNAEIQEHGNHLVVGHLGARSHVTDSEDGSMPMVYAGSRIENSLEGGIVYFWGSYLLQPEEMPVLNDAGPAPCSLPEKTGEEDAVRMAAYNVENLYDFINDPFDGCDFAGDEGCPDVRKPFNYVPVSGELYRQRIKAIARQIVEELNSPDILLIQEVEDQDIGMLTENGVVYGTDNNADGEVDALQELALEIVALGGPVYHTAIDRDGADYRGITCAWMYTPDTVRAALSSEVHDLLTADPSLPEGFQWMPLSKEASNPKAFNALYQGVDSEAELQEVYSRSAQLMQFQRVSDGQTIYLFNNHFSSGPNRRVERRTQQAAVNAALAAELMVTDPKAWVIVGGDLNVFPRPDDPLDPPSDQLGSLYMAGLFNVYDDVVEKRPAEAYSYIFRGVVNTLDHFFLSPSAKDALTYAGYLKLNASAPEAFSWEKPHRASDHDPVVVELK